MERLFRNRLASTGLAALVFAGCGEPSGDPSGAVTRDDLQTATPADGAIRECIQRNGGSAVVGLPADNGGGTAVHRWGNGWVQDLDHGGIGPNICMLRDGASTAYDVRLGVRRAFMNTGGATGPLGYPTDEEHEEGDLPAVQHFEGGSVVWTGTSIEVHVDGTYIGAVVDRIAAEIPTRSPGTEAGIGVMRLSTGERWGSRMGEPMVSASSMKWVWAAAAVRARPLGEVDRPARPTFISSNNETAQTLIDLAGGAAKVNDFSADVLGIPRDQLCLRNWYTSATNCPPRLGADNYFTPDALLTFLDHVDRGDFLPPEKAKALLGWGELSPRSGAPAGSLGTRLPAGTRFFHKAGWLPRESYPSYAVHNEIGIVEAPTGRYAVVLLFAHGANYWTSQVRALEWSSCVVYHAMAADVADPFAACR